MIYHIDVHVSDPLTKAHSAFCNTYQHDHEQELCRNTINHICQNDNLK